MGSIKGFAGRRFARPVSVAAQTPVADPAHARAAARAAQAPTARPIPTGRRNPPIYPK